MKLTVRIGEIMKKEVRTVGLDESIENAARIMKEEKIGSVVVTGDKNVKGIVTTSDIVYKHVADKRGTKVSEIMTTDIVRVSPDKTIEEAAHIMIEKGIEKLLVFEMDRLAGIITNNDILRIEPALVEIMLERLKFGKREMKEEDFEFLECETCGNFADDVEEVGGVYLCSECR